MKKRKTTRGKRAPLLILFIALLCLMLAMTLIRFSGVSLPGATENGTFKEMVDSATLLQYAKGVKQDVKDIVAELKESDFTEAEACDRKLNADVAALKEYLSTPVWSLVEKTPGIGEEVKTARSLISVAESFSADLVKPWIALQKKAPITSFKDEDGFHFENAALYLAFMDERLPDAKALIETLDGLDLSLVDEKGKIEKALTVAKPLISLYETYCDSLIEPGLTLLMENPPSELKTDEGFNFESIAVYSAFLKEKQPEIERFLDALETVDLSMVDEEHKLDGYLILAKRLLAIGGPANEELLIPALQLLQDHPFSSMKADGGFDVRVILAYLNFAEEKMPQVEALTDELASLDLSGTPFEEKIDKVLEKVAKLRSFYNENKQYIPALRVLLADGQDRYYLFPAQNSAEIRASGGFPGDVGAIRITDGVLRIGAFESVYGVFSQHTSNKANVTAQEIRLFTERMYTPHDADFCPDFTRVGEIWAYAYEDQMHIKVDGVISATPIIVQKLLAACEGSVELSNGMILDGESASRILQHDLYFEYKRAGKIAYTEEDMTDILFFETITKTMEQVTDDLSLGSILDYVEVWNDCIEERIIMMWMADPNEEAIMRQVGWAGALNSDPADPKLGIFFSSEQSGKMGYFLDILPEIGERVQNEDGSWTYDVTITLDNVITKEEQRIGGTWILGRVYTGNVMGDLTICAPNGGRIDEISANVPRGFRQEYYSGLDTRYIQWLIIERGAPLTVHLKVTTAPGIDTPLGLMLTPSLTNYR